MSKDNDLLIASTLETLGYARGFLRAAQEEEQQALDRLRAFLRSADGNPALAQSAVAVGSALDSLKGALDSLSEAAAGLLRAAG